MRLILLFVTIFLFLGCSNKSKIALNSDPQGAKIYDTKTKQYLGQTPVELTYIYDSDPSTPKCEIMRPITAIWGNNEAIITERDIIVCPGRDYKIVVDQIAFSKPRKYKVVKDEEEWYFKPYLGINIMSSSIKFDVTANHKSVTDVSNSYLYKIGFISDKDNRLEINYITYDLEESDFTHYSLDTIIPFYEDQVKPYFKFGLGYYSYEYEMLEYSNVNYNLGFGVLGSVTKNIEVDLGISNKRHVNYSNMAKAVGFDGIDGVDSKTNLKTISMGINYKF